MRRLFELPPPMDSKGRYAKEVRSSWSRSCDWTLSLQKNTWVTSWVDLQQRRAIIANTESRGETAIIEAHAPLAELVGYSSAMRSLSPGPRELFHGTTQLRTRTARRGGRIRVLIVVRTALPNSGTLSMELPPALVSPTPFSMGRSRKAVRYQLHHILRTVSTRRQQCDWAGYPDGG